MSSIDPCPRCGARTQSDVAPEDEYYKVLGARRSVQPAFCGRCGLTLQHDAGELVDALRKHANAEQPWAHLTLLPHGAETLLQRLDEAEDRARTIGGCELVSVYAKDGASVRVFVGPFRPQDMSEGVRARLAKWMRAEAALIERSPHGKKGRRSR